MKTIWEVVAEMLDAKVFSKLDVKSEFLQIELDKAKIIPNLSELNAPLREFLKMMLCLIGTQSMKRLSTNWKNSAATVQS